MTAAIVGCGLIAGGYDEEARAGAVNTHAGALARRGARIVACVEPDAVRRAQFMARWQVEKGYAALDAMLAAGLDVDVVCICTPTERHAADLMALLDSPVRAVFAEKPLAGALGDARRIAEAWRAAGRPLAVNYTRRWNPAFRELAADIAARRYGELTAASGWYGKGVVHNGSHMIDLLRLLIGEMKPQRAERSVADDRNEDPTVDAMLRTANGAPVRLIGTDYRHYDMFELQLAFSSAVVAIEEGGTRLRIRPLEETPGHRGHRRPGHGQFRDIAPRDALLRAFDNIAACLAGRERLASDAASALAAQEIATALADMART